MGCAIELRLRWEQEGNQEWLLRLLAWFGKIRPSVRKYLAQSVHNSSMYLQLGYFQFGNFNPTKSDHAACGMNVVWIDCGMNGVVWSSCSGKALTFSIPLLCQCCSLGHCIFSKTNIIPINWVECPVWKPLCQGLSMCHPFGNILELRGPLCSVSQYREKESSCY